MNYKNPKKCFYCNKKYPAAWRCDYCHEYMCTKCYEGTDCGYFWNGETSICLYEICTKCNRKTCCYDYLDSADIQCKKCVNNK